MTILKIENGQVKLTKVDCAESINRGQKVNGIKQVDAILSKIKLLKELISSKSEILNLYFEANLISNEELIKYSVKLNALIRATNIILNNVETLVFQPTLFVPEKLELLSVKTEKLLQLFEVLEEQMEGKC